jgi:hypothetical protein
VVSNGLKHMLEAECPARLQGLWRAFRGDLQWDNSCKVVLGLESRCTVQTACCRSYTHLMQQAWPSVCCLLMLLCRGSASG